MKASRLALVGFAAALATLVPAGAAFAYPDGTLDIIVDGSVCSNASFPVGVDANGTTADFTVTFSGQSKTGSDGSTFSTTFKAPVVTKTTKVPLDATADYNDGVSDQTLTASTVITVRDCSKDGTAPDDNGILPNTGGLELWLLVGGAGLLLVGGGAVATQRQRG